jgi:hypothetical protein
VETDPTETPVAQAVALEGLACAVSGETVGLDDELRVRPGEVDLVALDLRVDLGSRKAVAVLGSSPPGGTN